MTTMTRKAHLPPWAKRRALVDPYVETSMCTINAGSLVLSSTGSLANPTVTAQTGGALVLSGNNTVGGTTSPVITIVGNAVAANAGTLSLLDAAVNTVTLNTATPAMVMK